jgi:hypothetical protein
VDFVHRPEGTQQSMSPLSHLKKEIYSALTVPGRVTGQQTVADPVILNPDAAFFLIFIITICIIKLSICVCFKFFLVF